MSLTPKQIPEGAIRFNTDSSKMEVWIGDKWMQVAVSSPNLGDTTTASNASPAGARGVYSGGDPGSGHTEVIQFLTIPTTGDTIDFGDQDTTARNAGATSSAHGGL